MAPVRINVFKPLSKFPTPKKDDTKTKTTLDNPVNSSVEQYAEHTCSLIAN